VDVVFGAADRDRDHFVIFTYSCYIRPQARLYFFRDGIATVIGAEDQMDVVSGIRVGQCAAPPGLYPSALHAPTASAVGYDLSSLTGLSDEGLSDAAFSETEKPGSVEIFVFCKNLSSRI